MTTPARLRALLFVPGWGGTRVRPAIPSASQKVFPARCARPARSARMCIEAPRLRPVGADGCGAGLVEGIASRVAVWLDTEYPEDSLREPHAAAGAAAARHYAAIRAGGEDDVGSVLLALGGALEADGVLFRDLFVGPWEVANKVTDMVIAGARAFGTAVPPPAWQADDSGDQDQDALAFERFNFLSKVLDGGAAKEEVNGAVALAVGFRTHRFGWDGAGVSDGHFRLFGDVPPDVLGEEGTAEWSDTLKYLEGQLGLGKEEDSSGKQAAALETVVEAVHGFELTRIRRADEKDYAFRKREVVVKWLHLHAGY